MDPDSRDDDRIDALRDRIAEVESKVPDGPSRRQVLAGGGLLAAGGLLGGGASKQVSAQTAAGQVGTSSEPVDVEAAAVNAGLVSTEKAQITSEQTVYVRTDGDDSNDGSSASDAKATITAAIRDAPLNPNKSFLTVDVGSGTYGQTNVRDLPTSHIRIKGPSDQSAVIDGGANGGHAVEVGNGYVILENMEVKNGGDGCLRANQSTTVEARNCYFHDGPDIALQINDGSVYVDDSETVVEVDGAATTCITLIGGSHGKLNGEYRGADQTTVRLKEQSTAIMLSPTVTGVSGTTDNCIRLMQTSYAKIDNPTLQDATVGVRYTQWGQFKIQNGVTTSGLSLPISGSAGYVSDNNEGEEFVTIPRNSDTPTTNWDTGSASGNLIYNQTSGAFEGYSDDVGFGVTLQMGREVLDTGVVSLAAGDSQTITYQSNNAAGVPLMTEAWIADPDNAGGNAEVAAHVAWNDSGDRQEIVVEERGGSNGVDARWAVYRLPDPTA